MSKGANLTYDVDQTDIALSRSLSSSSVRLDFSMNPAVRHSVWALVFGAYFTWVAIFGVNQAQVQRCLTCSTLKQAQLFHQYTISTSEQKNVKSFLDFQYPLIEIILGQTRWCWHESLGALLTTVAIRVVETLGERRIAMAQRSVTTCTWQCLTKIAPKEGVKPQA
ncbi:hypothetical protein RRG08_022568 [Elysia crispata]|uniref:Uncharacterized protein n=1 Tax=Elysia crispata TaxID=231223 RepID=A0AAE0Z1Q9_9GAST|nr:hypothetical protein RRG08_022568 [Elysia crispata]